MTLSLRIEHTDGTTDTLELFSPDSLGSANAPSLSTLEKREQLVPRPDRPIATATVTVYEDAWSAVEPDIDDLNDQFYIDEDGKSDPIFGGRLADAETRGNVEQLQLDGPKRDALDARPSGGNEVYPPQSDRSIIENEILPRITTVSPGFVREQTASIAFSESRASPGKSLRKLAEATGAELRFTATGSPWELTYTARLGEDRTDETITAEDDIRGEPRVRAKVREEVTHIRVLGAQTGTAQISAESVAPGFDASTDRPVYRQRTDKDIQKQSRAQAVADELIAEYDGEPEYVEVEAEVAPHVKPALGDEFRVKIDPKGIDKNLRIMDITRIIDRAGERFRCLLSNRKLTREVQGDRQRRSVDEFRSGNAGQYFFNSERVSYDPIESGEPQEFAIRYPNNVVGDISATLIIKSRPYRGRVVSNGHSHSVDIPSHNHDVSFEAPDHTHGLDASASLANTAETSNPNNEASSVPDHTHTFAVDTSIFSASTSTVTSSNGGGSTESTTSETDLQAGVNTFTNETVSNVAVELNGTTLASGLSAPVDTEIDITGQLSGGANPVTITTDSLGEVEAIFTFEGIKNADS